ncbi:methionine adenosyltransferase domain-containing protein [Antarctobacter sp.]|uniref:methionine adenosyltransferase domain-containing protein n=1 Tax=Antarctobacter sp. TaxID=1872577 RepID=UPI002B268D1E|nr:methionine adenosyltransferase domain-containing protein [Antarctobacter sp.]
MKNFVMASDAVTMGHPDKLCDQISDAVVDAWLAEGARDGVNAECALASGVAFLSVRSGAAAPVDAAQLVRRVVGAAGYDGIDEDRMSVILDLSRDETMSADLLSAGIARHMVTAIGYACEGPGAMPAPVMLARGLAAGLDSARASGRLGWLLPDAKAQVAVRFEDRRPVQVTAVALSLGTVEAMSEESIASILRDEVIAPVVARQGLAQAEGLRLSVQAQNGPGGPAVHTGLTGRKTGEDSYGAFVRHSGSALSGKDPSRIDRVADYAARHAARGVVAAGLARECEVQLSYIPGDAAPASIEVDCHDSGSMPDAEIRRLLTAKIDFRLVAMVERFGLWDLPAAREGRFYQRLATYGQIGRDDLQTPWDAPTLAAELG